MPALKPCCMLVGMCLYLSSRLLEVRAASQPCARYGVVVLRLGLGEAAALSPVVVASASGTTVPGEV